MSKDNILYIGPYREFSGMGNAARNYIKALYRSGNNVSIRPIYNDHSIYPELAIEKDILELEHNSKTRYHKVIQHCYPHQFIYDSRFDTNIGITHFETADINKTISEYLNILDVIVVGSSANKNTVLSSGFNKNIHVIPEPIDIEIIQNYITNNKKETKDYNYKFYTIGNFSDRKNITTLLTAFLILSNHYPDIELVLKFRNISNTSEINRLIEYEFEKIYSSVRNNFVKKPKLFVGDISYDNILYIHHNNDCYISSSFGESFGYSALEAMVFNNNIVCTNNTGFNDLLKDGCGLLVASELDYCIDKDRIFAIYNSVYEKWWKPKIDDMVIKMAMCINESEKDKKQRIDKQNSHLQNYTFENIGELFNKI